MYRRNSFPQNQSQLSFLIIEINIYPHIHFNSKIYSSSTLRKIQQPILPLGLLIAINVSPRKLNAELFPRVAHTEPLTKQFLGMIMEMGMGGADQA